MPDDLERYLAAVGRSLRVHPRRRARILEELAAHPHESAAAYGPQEALRRMGPPAELARGFTPHLRDRAWEERDRLAALLVLAAMAGSLPMAADLAALNRDVGQSVLLPGVLLATCAGLALAACALTLARRVAGLMLAVPLAALVTVTAILTLAGLPPMGGLLGGYGAAIRQGFESSGCAGRTLAACSADHESEIRFAYALGAEALSLLYLAAVAGWTPRRP